MSNRCSEHTEGLICIDEIGKLKVDNNDGNSPLLTLLDSKKISNYFICPVCKSPMDKINIRFCYICGWEEYLL